MKASVSSQKARVRSASCSVASATASGVAGSTPVAEPCSAHALSGRITSRNTPAATTRAVRQPSTPIKAAKAGNETVLAKPATKVSAVMPRR